MNVALTVATAMLLLLLLLMPSLLVSLSIRNQSIKNIAGFPFTKLGMISASMVGHDRSAVRFPHPITKNGDSPVDRSIILGALSCSLSVPFDCNQVTPLARALVVTVLHLVWPELRIVL